MSKQDTRSSREEINLNEFKSIITFSNISNSKFKFCSIGYLVKKAIILMDKRTRNYILEHQLSSYMNTTKWKKLVHEITSNEMYDPLVNIKLIFDEENTNSFSPVWWNEVERDGFELIEWLQIQPFNTEKGVRLTDSTQIDYTDFIQKGLDKHSIQYEYEHDIFTIYGYKRMK